MAKRKDTGESIRVAADVAEENGENILAEALVQLTNGNYSEVRAALARLEWAAQGIGPELAEAIMRDAMEAYAPLREDVVIPDIPHIIREEDGYWVEFQNRVPLDFQEEDEEDAYESESDELQEREQAEFVLQGGTWHNEGPEVWTPNEDIGFLTLDWRGVESVYATRRVDAIMEDRYPGARLYPQDTGLWLVELPDGRQFDLYLSLVAGA